MSKEYNDSDIANAGRRDSIREIQEMEQIERGLEAFLEQELQNMEHEEKEIDVIGSSGRGNSQRKPNSGHKNDYKDNYIEDWDVPRKDARRSGVRSTEVQKGNSRSQSTKRGGFGKSTDRSRSQKRGNERSDRREKPTASRQSKKDVKGGGNKPRKKQRFKKLKRFVTVLAVIFVLMAGGLYWLVGNVYGKMKYEEIVSVTDAPYKEDGVINILLIGNDSRENGEDGRSDAMILLSISSKTRKIYITSLLRDMYVEIPGHDGNRLNAAYSYGGAELLMETIEKNFDISVNRYVLVNFEAFANLVDSVGGVELELTSQEIEYVNGYLVEYNMLTNRPQGTDNMDTSVSGLVHLNGPQALAYTRNRYLGTDFGRTERQRKVLMAVIRKLPATVLTNPGELIDGLFPNLTTNLTRGECYLLSLQAGKLLTYDIEQGSIPLPGTYKDASIRGMSVLEVDFEENKKYLRENIYGQMQ